MNLSINPFFSDKSYRNFFKYGLNYNFLKSVSAACRRPSPSVGDGTLGYAQRPGIIVPGRCARFRVFQAFAAAISGVGFNSALCRLR